MGSIRPLFTITILVVVGAYLYVKINEGPARPHAGANGEGQSQEGIPPLAAAGGGATLAQDTAAPAWPPAESKAPLAAPAMSVAPAASAVASTDNTTSAGDTTKNGLPEVPPIPELPELPQTADAVPPVGQPAAALPTGLPKEVPSPRNGDEAGPQLGAGASPDLPNALPALPVIPAETTGNTAAPAPLGAGAAFPTAPNAANTLPVMPNDTAAASVALPAASDRYGTSATTPSASLPPLTPAAPSTTSPNTLPGTAPGNPMTPPIDGRYGAGASTTPLSAASPLAAAPLTSQPLAAAGASFAASWPAIQAALDRRDLKQAHQMLSKWHGDESLSPADAQKVDDLLGQLAGTVIYSTEHQLEPARVVKPGETLETIAKEYNVPWQLLAKINSIPAPDQLRPGQSLKVVRGPFSAVVDLHRNELTLEVDGRYAGTFAVSVPPGTVVEGQWLVEQKLAGSQNSVTPAAYAAAPAADRSIVLRNAAGAPAGGPVLTIASGPATGTTTGAAAIRVAPQDAEDLSDILSIGSRVIVRK
jgi:LysM repeat protein